MAIRSSLLAASCILAALVGVDQSVAQQKTQPVPSAATSSPASSASASSSSQLPDTPSSSQNANQLPQATASQNTAKNQQQQPSGTAAAQTGTLSGTAVSRPAGIAIAPAKQKRSRSLVIKLGLIAGAGIALGTVAALSAASGSKPPGAP